MILGNQSVKLRLMIGCIEGRALAALNSQYSSVSISSLNGGRPYWVLRPPDAEGSYVFYENNSPNHDDADERYNPIMNVESKKRRVRRHEL